MKKNKKDADWWGIFLSVILTVTVIGVVVFLFLQFVKIYTPIQIDGVSDLKARQFEMLTLMYAIIMATNIISGARAIKLSLFDNEDMKLFKVLPISPVALFFSKFIFVYLKQILFCALCVIPINLTFGIVMKTGVAYVFISLLICVLMPLVTMLFSALISLPVYYIRKAIKSRYVLSLLFLNLITGLVFWGYSELLEFFKNLVSSGDIRFFFNEERMFNIIEITKYMYPANIFSALLIGKEVGKNIGILIAFVIGFGGLSILVVSLMFKLGLELNESSKIKPVMTKNVLISKKQKVWVSLLQKEFITVLRTPSYAFSYFSISVIMPLMVYFVTRMGSELIGDMALINCNLQMALTVVFLFTVLCNTFCATNISREGKAFYTLKTMPISFKQIIAVKIGFCSAISIIATLISVIIITATGYLTLGQGAFVFISASLFGEAQILFATRKDFNHPKFFEDGIDATENSSTASALVIVGVFIALGIGASSLIYAIFKGLIAGQSVALFTYLLFSLAPLLFFIISLVYLLTGLEKRYEIISENS